MVILGKRKIPFPPNAFAKMPANAFSFKPDCNIRGQHLYVIFGRDFLDSGQKNGCACSIRPDEVKAASSLAESHPVRIERLKPHACEEPRPV